CEHTHHDEQTETHASQHSAECSRFASALASAVFPPLLTLLLLPKKRQRGYARAMAVTITVLASGSRGNATVVSSSRTRILVDAGISCKETFKRLRAAGEDPEQIDAILISHEHSDHVYGLPVLARKLKVPVYMT